jgi:hypothetical protein
LQTPGNEEKYNVEVDDVAHNTTGWHPRQSDSELFLLRPQHSAPRTHVTAPTMLCDDKLLALLNVSLENARVTSNAADGPFQLLNVLLLFVSCSLQQLSLLRVCCFVYRLSILLHFYHTGLNAIVKN